MEQSSQIDVLLLFLILLSVLLGFMRGFCIEFIRLLIYVFSGILGYCFIPMLRPLFSVFITHEKTVWTLSLITGSFMAWFVLRLFILPLAQQVRNSRFSRLDRSLGIFFGLGRIGVFLLLFSFLVSAFSPAMMEQSKLLRWSFAGVKIILKEFPKLDIQKQIKKEEESTGESLKDPDRQAEKKDWKETAVDYMLEEKIETSEGERSLFSIASEIIADMMSEDMGRPIPSEMVETIMLIQMKGSTSQGQDQQIQPIIKKEEQDENFGNR